MIAANAGATGTLNIGVAAPRAPGTITAPGLAFGAGTGTLNFNHTSANYVFAPAISGNGTVNVLAGTTTLTGANSYSGATNVNAGTLRAGAPNTFSPNSAVTVASGGTLDLAGFDQTIPGLINHGIVRTGGSPDTGTGTVLTVAGDYTAGSTLALNTFLAGDGSPSDRLDHRRRHGNRQYGDCCHQRRRPGLLSRPATASWSLIRPTAARPLQAPSALGAPVVAGPYEYMLERGSVTGGNDRSLVPALGS